MLRLFTIIARLPLPLVHLLGAGLGLAHLLRSRTRRTLVDNLRFAGLYSPWMLLRAAAGVGRGILEMVPVWLRPAEETLGWVRECHGWEHVEAARARGQGILMLMPHLGCFELVGTYFSARLPMTALYRPPRQEWVHGLMKQGRERGQLVSVPPTRAGVRALYSALKQKQAVCILPDQVAGKGEGAWTTFFGQKAYMPTLPYRLLASTQAVPLMFFCERLPWGRGYRLWITPIDDLPAEPAQALAVVNRRIEALTRVHPDQYLWTYRIQRSATQAGLVKVAE